MGASFENVAAPAAVYILIKARRRWIVLSFWGQPIRPTGRSFRRQPGRCALAGLVAACFADRPVSADRKPKQADDRTLFPDVESLWLVACLACAGTLSATVRMQRPCHPLSAPFESLFRAASRTASSSAEDGALPLRVVGSPGRPAEPVVRHLSFRLVRASTSQ